MTAGVRLWMRGEERPTERRAPIVPDDAGQLVAQGISVTVEEAPQRVFPAADYAAAGCRIAPPGSWAGADRDQYVIGLKELPGSPEPLVHRHIYFGHAYKGQQGAGQLLQRFAAGGGALLDLEYLTDASGRRLAAFGFWAGYVGAALAVLHLRGQLGTPLHPLSRPELDSALRGGGNGDSPRVLVVGALGRCGSGACSALEAAGLSPARWDRSDTRVLDRGALLAHDALVNTVLSTARVAPFVRPADLADPARRLSLVADVTCDVTAEHNAVPIYDMLTSWQQPVRRVHAGPPPMDVIAIDNLPSLLPREASVAFSAQLLPLLLILGTDSEPWQRCRQAFLQAG